jgi:ribonuclease R
MKRAQYGTECTGHFGLSAKYYTHFTSPIRRYPDLQIHRIIKENIKGGLSEKRFTHYDKILPEVAKQCSTTERRADDAERDVEKLKKAEYMSYHIGEEFEGVISGITQWGIYVELPNTIEGFIPIESIPGSFECIPERFLLKGAKESYSIGETLLVKVIDVDFYRRRTIFALLKKAKENV